MVDRWLCCLWCILLRGERWFWIWESFFGGYLINYRKSRLSCWFNQDLLWRGLVHDSFRSLRRVGCRGIDLLWVWVDCFWIIVWKYRDCYQFLLLRFMGHELTGDLFFSNRRDRYLDLHLLCLYWVLGKVNLRLGLNLELKEV